MVHKYTNTIIGIFFYTTLFYLILILFTNFMLNLHASLMDPLWRNGGLLS